MLQEPWLCPLINADGCPERRGSEHLFAPRVRDLTEVEAQPILLLLVVDTHKDLEPELGGYEGYGCKFVASAPFFDRLLGHRVDFLVSIEVFRHN